MAGSQPHPEWPEALFPRLPHGRGAPDHARVARHQRARLQGAMVAAVARHGYAATTVGELVAVAGVSKRSFYEHFASKQECFLSTFDEIIAQAVERIRRAYQSRDGLRERLRAGLEACMDLVAAEPAAARLVIVDSLALGRPGLEHRERAAARFELMIARSFAQAPERGEVSGLEVRAIVAGIRRVIRHRLGEGRPERLADQIDQLVDWALAYQRPPGAHAPATAAVPDEPAAEAEAEPEPAEAALDWREPPNSARSRALLSQRERITRAVAAVAIERGYGGLSIPAISAAAGVSNQTFYENFAGKQQAFDAVFDRLVAHAFERVAAAFAAEATWPEAVAAGVRAMLSHVAADPLFARFVFGELPTSGPSGLGRSERALERFTAFLAPDALPAGATAPPPVALEAIAGGVWAVIRHEIAEGREAALPTLAAPMTDILLVPFGLAPDDGAPAPG